jgi:hypothetical protein
MFNKRQEMYVRATLWSRKVLSIFLALTFMKHPYHASNSCTKQI